MFHLKIFFVLTFLFWKFDCENNITTASIEDQIHTYEEYIKASVITDRQDRLLVTTWTEDLLVKQVNMTTGYRLQMTRHKDHSFKSMRFNEKWKQCLKFHTKEVNTSEHTYYDKERECLRTANLGREDKIQAVTQFEKEIRKWRKSYKYMSRHCLRNSGDKEQAELCLVDVMLKDNYNVAFQRLILLKQQSMKDLYEDMAMEAMRLDDCLKSMLSEFLETVRSLMATITKCYNGGRIKN